VPTVVLFSKPDCHLCEQAEDILNALSRELPFRWRRVNIESDPALFARYRFEIPVIAVDGGPELKWPTTRERVKRALVGGGVG
jgi:glutaredoxin